MKKVHGKPIDIPLNEEFGARLRICAASDGEDKPTGVMVEFTVEDRDFTSAFVSDTPAKLNRIIAALQDARRQVWGM